MSNKKNNYDGPKQSFGWITFAFEYKGNQIVVRNSNWKAVEQVFINDELIHDKKSWSLQMNETFKMPSGESLKVNFGFSFRKGLFIEANDNEGIVYIYYSNKDYKYWLMIGFCIIVGAILGFNLAS